MKKLLLGLLLLSQCSVNDKIKENYIHQLTTNTWFLVDPANPNVITTTVLPFVSNGSFTMDFIDFNGITTSREYTLQNVIHESFAFYSFEYTVGRETLTLIQGVGIGFNTVAQKASVYAGKFKNNIVPPPATANNETIKNWYKDQYKESNFIRHTGLTIALQ